MPRIVIGNRGSILALAQARSVLAELATEWPDVNIVMKTVQVRGPREASGGAGGELLEALQRGAVNIAVQGLEDLPAELPVGLTLAAVTRRLEPRCTLITKGGKRLQNLPQAARVGVRGARDRAFLLAHFKHFDICLLSGDMDNDLADLAAGEFDALILPAASLIQLERRHAMDVILEPEVFMPAAGQGSLGLVVRADDDLAGDLAYTLQHRPSFDRASAERSFVGALSDHGDKAAGALATVSSEGELSLFGALASLDGALVIQAEVSGDAAEAKDLGRELAQDVRDQLSA
ncbi:MAG: hydroxymethylbilane synthase [Deinococcota bacterium]|jgi:hydroxymethylbilane synthase|nr:hydroxymethylbilane synthase [Deinococcota bacterium]